MEIELLLSLPYYDYTIGVYVYAMTSRVGYIEVIV